MDWKMFVLGALAFLVIDLIVYWIAEWFLLLFPFIGKWRRGFVYTSFGLLAGLMVFVVAFLFIGEAL